MFYCGLHLNQEDKTRFKEYPKKVKVITFEQSLRYREGGSRQGYISLHTRNYELSIRDEIKVKNTPKT